MSQVVLSPTLKTAGLALVAVTRDDADRLPYWIQYYRSLGVEEFVIINNRSSDETLTVLADERGMTVFNADGSFKSSHFGIDWVNFVAERLCRNKWLLFVDTDEFLVYDGVESHKIPELVQVLDSRSIKSLQCMMVDLYSERPVEDNVVGVGADPLSVCRLYDSHGYRHTRDKRTRTVWIKGGPRARTFFAGEDGAPALNKTPLVRWKRFSRFVQVAHRLWPANLNDSSRGDGLTGALLHQKFLSTVGQKLKDSNHVAEHDREYLRYAGFNSVENLRTQDSREYNSSRDLVDDSLIGRIPWPSSGREGA